MLAGEGALNEMLGRLLLGITRSRKEFKFPAGARNFSLHHSFQTGSGAHPASCPMDTKGSFLGAKAAGV
jgi:hypothetical protein